jgi:hypothetical protein
MARHISRNRMRVLTYQPSSPTDTQVLGLNIIFVPPSETQVRGGLPPPAKPQWPHVHGVPEWRLTTRDCGFTVRNTPIRRVAARLPCARHDATLTPCQCHTKPYPYMKSAHMEHTSDRSLIHALRLKTNARKGSPPQPRVASRLSGQHAGAEPEPGTRQGRLAASARRAQRTPRAAASPRPYRSGLALLPKAQGGGPSAGRLSCRRRRRGSP